MKLIFQDYETYYDDEFSLRKMTPAEYILDPRFEVIGCAFKEGLNGRPFWLDGPDVRSYLAGLQDHPSICLISHNALFDACITAWHYNYIPKLTTCTLSISRAMIGHKLNSLSLDSVGKFLGLGGKLDGSRALAAAKGMNLQALKSIPNLYYNYMEYARTDVEQCAEIYTMLVCGQNYIGPTLPLIELAFMDMVFRCTIQPVFQLDQNVLAQHLHNVLQAKEKLLAELMLMTGTSDKKELLSNDKFAELLRSIGVEPPMKISPTTGRQTYAFAKTDIEFLDLLDHPNPAVQALMAARMGYKSTLEETRTNRFISISRLSWPSTLDKEAVPQMPMPLKAYGAHTHRLGGDWSLNVQNLSRVSDKGGGNLRRALIAPEGYEVVTVDAAQIEARLTAWLCGCSKLVTQFANGEDVYSNFASSVFGHPVNKKDNPEERFVGKTGILSLGFGVGWQKFQHSLAVLSENQIGKRITITADEAKRIVTTYRTYFCEIPKMWRYLGYQVIPALANQGELQVGPLLIKREAIILPGLEGKIGTGLRLHYDNLHVMEDEWQFTYGGKVKKLYGGKLLENIIQALDRVIVMGAALRIQRRIAPYRLAQQAHDENAYVVPKELVPELKQILLEEMTRRPDWAFNLPLAAEVGSGPNYGASK